MPSRHSGGDEGGIIDAASASKVDATDKRLDGLCHAGIVVGKVGDNTNGFRNGTIGDAQSAGLVNEFRSDAVQGNHGLYFKSAQTVNPEIRPLPCLPFGELHSPSISCPGS